jgi:hypothetical protein
MSIEYKFKRLGSIPPHAEDWNLINSNLKQKNKFLEIGVAEGRSVIRTADTLMTNGSELVCVDPFIDMYFEPEEEFFDHNISILKTKYPNYKFTKIKATSNIALSQMILNEDKFDFIYIDARKFGASVIEDFAMSFMVLDVGGILMLDDYYNDRDQNPIRDSKWAANMLLYQYQNFIQVLFKGKRCIIKKTRNLPLYL